MAKSPLIKKLQIKPGYRVLILNSPAGYLKGLGKLPENVKVETRAVGTYDLIQLFVSGISELEKFAPAVLKSLKLDGVFWVSYPKKTSGVKSDISRDVGWDILKKNGLRPVAGISIDETWSGLRFRPRKLVGK